MGGFDVTEGEIDQYPWVNLVKKMMWRQRQYLEDLLVGCLEFLQLNEILHNKMHLVFRVAVIPLKTWI